MRKEDYDVFIDKFEPEMLDGDNIKLYETYGDDYKEIRQKSGEQSEFLWTLIDGGNGKLYLSPGFHLVNRLNYVITKKPWKDGQRDYLYAN